MQLVNKFLVQIKPQDWYSTKSHPQPSSHLDPHLHRTSGK